MGNRAIIKGKNQALGVYVHWNGGYDSVNAFCTYCKLKGYRSPETDSYGIARLAQVIGNFFGGNVSVGIEIVDNNPTPKQVEELWLDNGIYEIEGWKIVNHMNPDIVIKEDHEEYDLMEFLETIDENMPTKEQLGKEFLHSEEMNVTDLKVGDVVYYWNELYGKYERHTVIGIAEGETIRNGHNMDGIPYIDLYENNGSYDGNSNNYLAYQKTIRVCKEK